jgi:hypothetical protein
MLKTKYLRYIRRGIKIGPLPFKAKAPGGMKPAWTQEG